MTTSKPRPSLTSQRPSRPRLTSSVCALLLSLTPLIAQQPSHLPDSHSFHALAVHYQLPVAGQGPVLSSFEIAQGAILLRFTNAGDGLRLKGSGRDTVQISGADHNWFPADAHLVNGVVVVSTSLVQLPTSVRYSWQDPAAATLFNSAGQPAAPFHTGD